MEKVLRNKLYIAIFIAPALLFFAVTFLIPVLHTAYSSFFSYDGIGNMKFIAADNYRNAFKDQTFWISLKNTILCVFMSLLIQLPLALFFALLLNRNLKGSQFFRKVFFIPVIISSAIVGLLWTKIYDVNSGLLNEFLRGTGLGVFEKEWLADPVYVAFYVFLSGIWQLIGYHMLILYAGLKSIPDTYYEAAELDGANGLQTLVKVTLPLLSNILKVDVVLLVTGSLRVFDSVYIMTQGGPYETSMVLALQMYNEAFKYMRYGYGSTLAVLLVVLCLAAAVIINGFPGANKLEY